MYNLSRSSYLFLFPVLQTDRAREKAHPTAKSMDWWEYYHEHERGNTNDLRERRAQGG